MTERNSCRLRWNSSDGGTSRGTGERPFDGSSSSCFSPITPSDGSAAMGSARSPAVFDFACGRQSILSAGTRSSTRAVTGASRSSSSAIVLVMGIVTLLGNRIFAAHYTSAITVETDYRRWATLLREIAEKKFRVPQEDAEALVNDVFIAYLLRIDAIRNPEKWLARAAGLPPRPGLRAARGAPGAAAARSPRAHRPRVARHRGSSRGEAHRGAGAQPSARALSPRAPPLLPRRLFDRRARRASEDHARLRRASAARVPPAPSPDLPEAREREEALNGHYDETTLADYLDAPDEFAEREVLERHIEVCRRCRDLLAELRELEAALQSGEAWEAAEALSRERDAPEAISSPAPALAREEALAAQRLGRIVYSPIMFRRATVAARAELHNAGAVRFLCAQSRELREKQPMHALTLADAAAALCDRLPRDRY